MVIWPSCDKAWRHPATFALRGHIPVCGNHLAAVWQVGEGASLTLDAMLIWELICRFARELRRNFVLLLGPAHDDPECVIRQWLLQRLGLIPGRAHPNVPLFVGR